MIAAIDLDSPEDDGRFDVGRLQSQGGLCVRSRQGQLPQSLISPGAPCPSLDVGGIERNGPGKRIRCELEAAGRKECQAPYRPDFRGTGDVGFQRARRQVLRDPGVAAVELRARELEKRRYAPRRRGKGALELGAAFLVPAEAAQRRRQILQIRRFAGAQPEGIMKGFSRFRIAPERRQDASQIAPQHRIVGRVLRRRGEVAGSRLVVPTNMTGKTAQMQGIHVIGELRQQGIAILDRLAIFALPQCRCRRVDEIFGNHLR